MAENKRWTVTYTKHIRQKRKVYQDGMLELDCSSNKIVLYDDSEKLLESRFLKKDEIVESGVTVTFESHLVDVGTHAVSSKPLTELDIKSREKKPSLKTLSERKNILQNTSLEWIVLYTAQVTQKSKKYHDGLLKLKSCGSRMNQMILLDKEGSVLSSKYVNSVDHVKTGQTYEFPNYLVQICEQRILGEEFKKNSSSGETENPCSSQIGTIFSTTGGPRNELLHGGFKKNTFSRAAAVSHSQVNKSIETEKEFRKKPFLYEWNVLYTTQLSQKAKRYHDGILQTMSSGSCMNQATLLNEDGVVLSNKYLKSIDCIKTGLTFELPNYLVQICEPKTLDSEFENNSVERVSVSKSSESREVSRSRRFISSIKKKDMSKESATTNNAQISTAYDTGKNFGSEDKENFRRISISEEISAGSISQVTQACPFVQQSGIKCNLVKEVTDCPLDDTITNRKDPGIKPFRDVSQILFKLKKSTPGEVPDPRELLVKQVQFSEYSKPVVFAPHVKRDIEELATPDMECTEAFAEISQKAGADHPMHHEACATQGVIPENVSPGSKILMEIPNPGVSKSLNCLCGEDRKSDHSSMTDSSSVKPLDISTSSLHMKISKDVTSEQATKYIDDVSNMLSKDPEVEVPVQASVSVILPGFENNTMQLQDRGKCEISSQLVVGTMGVKFFEESLPWGKLSRSNKGKKFNESTAKKITKTDELPSFDLGF